MKKLKLAACGIDCAECGSYKVTMEHDVKSAEGLVAWYKNQGWIGENEGAEAVMKKNPLCKGCWNWADDCFSSVAATPVEIFVFAVQKNKSTIAVNVPTSLVNRIQNLWVASNIIKSDGIFAVVKTGS